jgi:hypothetical protein
MVSSGIRSNFGIKLMRWRYNLTCAALVKE